MTNAAGSTPPSKQPSAPPKHGIRVRGLKGCTEKDRAEKDWRGQSRDVWLDIEVPSPEEVETLRHHFTFNKLALEDALQTEHWSRFERYPEHLFLIFRTLAEPEDMSDRTEGVAMFWFPEQRALVTFRHEPVTYLEAVWKDAGSFSERAPEDILYDLLQRGTDTFFTFLDELEDRTEALEQCLFDNPPQRAGKVGDARAQPLYQEIFALRRTLISTRKRVLSAREYIMQFSRHATEVSPEGGMYLRDVAEHLARVYGGLDAAREVLGGLLEVYLSVENQRLNEVIRTLTTVSTIFLPLTFLAGVWGMNFEYQPEFSWRYGYLFAWASFIVLGGLLLWYFKRKRWW